MKPVKQTRFGEEGNCWQACIASILELELDEVPDFVNDYDDWYPPGTKVTVKSESNFKNAWLRGYNWNYEGEPKRWELDFVFSYIDDEGYVKNTIEYKFYNNEDSFSVSAFIMECFETGYEGHQLEYGISLDHNDKQTILSKIRGFEF